MSTQNIRDVEGGVLLRQLGAGRGELADQAARELFRRGETVLPGLMGCRGRVEPYLGRPLGNPRGSVLVPQPGQEGIPEGKLVTVEVVCLYLVSAILSQQH